ncbi:MAG: V-type ATPase 116kDa subunit family protein [Chloroflexota bacterium]
MFFPKAMTELELIVPAKDLVAVTKVLGSRGNFQQIDSTYLGLENLGPSTWQETSANYSGLERRIQVLAQNLNLSDEYSGPAKADSDADISIMQAAVERIEASVKDTIGQMSAEKKNLEQLESQFQQLQPISDLNYEVGALRKSKYLYSIVGVMPADQVSRLETSLARVPYTFFKLRDDAKKPLVWLFGPRSNSDVIDRAARSAFLTPLVLPDELHGTPAEALKEVSSSIDASKRKIAELDRVIAKSADAHKKELYELWRDVHANRVMSDAIARFGQLRHTYVVVGWVPATDVDALVQSLKKVSKEVLVEVIPVERSGHSSNAPVSLQNAGFMGAFEILVNTYARPRYEEIDPTFLMTFTFPLLYGAMYGDVGHGLVLALIGWVISRKAKLGELLIWCGISGMIFGFLFGSVFGFEEILPHSPIFGRFFWMSPINNVLGILKVAIGAGIVLLVSANLLNLYNAARSKDWGRFFFDSNGLAGLILYLSFLVILGNVASKLFTGDSFVPEILLAVGRISILVTIAQILFFIGLLLAVIFSHPLQHWMHDGHFVVEGGWGIFAIQSAAEVLEKIISMLSNTLSYLRVGAFAIVHAGFTGAVFVIAKLVGGGHEVGFGYWAVVVLGNLFVIGLEGFIVTIQTMRLHYYEFFSKFFLGGGAEYQPLTLGKTQEN